MRYMIGSQMGWAALPLLVLASIVYIWVADKIVFRAHKTAAVEPETKVAKAA